MKSGSQQTAQTFVRHALALSDIDSSSYEIETVRRYSRVVRLLSALLDTTVVHSADESAWLDSTQLAEIESPQTRTALRKLRTRRVQTVLAAEGPPVGWTEAAISHAQPLVGWRRYVQIAGVTIEAGWQYQEGQFRLCVVLQHLEGRSDVDRRAREAFAASHPGLFDFLKRPGFRGGSVIWNRLRWEPVLQRS